MEGLDYLEGAIKDLKQTMVAGLNKLEDKLDKKASHTDMERIEKTIEDIKREKLDIKTFEPFKNVVREKLDIKDFEPFKSVMNKINRLLISTMILALIYLIIKT